MDEDKERSELEETMRLKGTDSGAELCKAFDAMKDCVLRNNEEIKELKAVVERQKMLLERYFRTGKCEEHHYAIHEVMDKKTGAYS